MTRNKIWRLVLSIGFAFGLWLYVITVVSPGSQQGFAVDVKLTEENKTYLSDRNLIITAYDESVNVQLEGNRIDLNQLGPNDIDIKLDVSSLQEEGTFSIPYTVTFPGNDNNSISVKTKNPEKVTVKVETWGEKTVDVEIVKTGDLFDDTYKVVEEKISHEKLHISGPKSIVDQIVVASVDVDLTQKTDNISGRYQVTLRDERGQPVNAELITLPKDVKDGIQLDMVINKFVQLPLEITAITGGGATADNCEITVQPAVMAVSGSRAKLEGLTSLVVGTIDLSTVTENVSTHTITVTMPNGITNRDEFQEVTVTVKLKGLKTKTLTVRNISVENEPDKLIPSGIPNSLDITLRGPADQMDKLNENKVSVILDLNNTKVGVNTVTAYIKLDSELSGVKTLHPCQVDITMRQE